jgi:DNA polymerase III gamma/tau subunit
MELYKRLRPTRYSDLRGQPEAVKLLLDMSKRKAFPHCLLLTGPSGTGKTTAARITARKLECSEHDLNELNIADARGIEVVREIRSTIHLSPMGGKSRIWLLDECQKSTVDFQSALLKLLEDPPDHAYFILCTTEPEKLLRTIHTRATQIKFNLLKRQDMESLLTEIADKEEFKLSEDVRDHLVECAEGSPRKALVLLDQILGLKTEQDQLAAISVGENSSQVIDLCRELINPKGTWGNTAKILKALEDEPESARRAILGYALAVLLNSGSKKAYSVINCFEKNFFDSGKAGLVASCFEVFQRR